MKEESQNYQNKSTEQSLSKQGLLPHQAPQDSSRLIRSYGRIKSRRLSDHKNFLLENLLANYEIYDEHFASKNLSIENSSPKKLSTKDSSLNKAEKILAENSPPKSAPANPRAFDGKFTKISFEIGFGFGDFLFAKAQSTPNQMFLGCEPHLNGVVNVLAKLEEAPLSNVKISRQDARELLSKFDDNFFDEIYILFPDPWPKIKHFKRRLINLEFLDNLLAKKIKSGGKLIIATDHDSYKTWILSAVSKSRQFKWEANCKHDWQTFPNDWITTKYQKKAALEGRVSVIFNLTNA